MTPDQKLLVKDTWAKIKPIQEQVAQKFYTRLFEQYPEVKPYFKGDMKEQGRKLMAMLNTAVNGLDNLPELVQPLRDMGARHVQYGVRDEDYDKVAAALLWTLQQGLGTAFTPKVEAAWTETYTVVAETMKAGAAASVDAA